MLTVSAAADTVFLLYDFITNDKWPPLHPTSVHWFIRFWG